MSLIPSDLEIAQGASLQHINQIAASLGLDPETDLEHYGKYMAKINLSVLKKYADRPHGKYIDVTAITPTPLGEGKSTVTVGLGQAMKHIGKRALVTVRQPSQGPTFGVTAQVVMLEVKQEVEEVAQEIGTKHRGSVVFASAQYLQLCDNESKPQRQLWYGIHR